MNANTIFRDEMTLEDKLAAIDHAMEEALKNTPSKIVNGIRVATDPADLLICEGCS